MFTFNLPGYHKSLAIVVEAMLLVYAIYTSKMIVFHTDLFQV